MPEVYGKYFEGYKIQWKSLDKKSYYSQKWTDLNPDACPDTVYREYCKGWSDFGEHCFVNEKIAIKCFHLVLKKRKSEEKFKDLMSNCKIRLVNFKKRVEIETEQIVQN